VDELLEDDANALVFKISVDHRKGTHRPYALQFVRQGLGQNTLGKGGGGYRATFAEQVVSQAYKQRPRAPEPLMQFPPGNGIGGGKFRHGCNGGLEVLLDDERLAVVIDEGLLHIGDEELESM